ncbi:hypothetical protein RRG08_037074 [Elysia crispata]|uniref:Uncharacterized protein n=1 Tax=Elysia crispata TaxID=231223 RepID=A0AAE0ZWE6_9GAST|nr:hypothetical protein RRG08_037074 [Elysia crispata]
MRPYVGFAVMSCNAPICFDVSKNLPAEECATIIALSCGEPDFSHETIVIKQRPRPNCQSVELAWVSRSPMTSSDRTSAPIFFSFFAYNLEDRDVGTGETTWTLGLQVVKPAQCVMLANQQKPFVGGGFAVAFVVLIVLVNISYPDATENDMNYFLS